VTVLGPVSRYWQPPCPRAGLAQPRLPADLGRGHRVDRRRSSSRLSGEGVLSVFLDAGCQPE